MIDLDKILIIKRSSDEFEKYYNAKFKESGIDVWNIEDIHFEHEKKFILRQAKNGYYFIKNGLSKQIKKYEMILVFDAYGIVPWLKFFAKKNARIILWCWNIADEHFKCQVNKINDICEVWTFDPNDAKKNDWKLNTQFYFFNNMLNEFKDKTSETGVVFFVGGDKGRYSTLCDLEEQFCKRQILCDFWMVGSSEKEYVEGKHWVRNKGLSYLEVLEHIKRCSYILDLGQEGQEGITARVLEALFYEKKLITNNKNVIDLDFYDKDNIFIIGKDSWDDFEEFILMPHKCISKEILAQYTFEQWLHNF